jgi:uncharacterized membrane protein YraQ (UPF0718 family)
VYEYIKILIVKFWITMTEMSPYLLFGFFAAGVLSIFISARTLVCSEGGAVWCPDAVVFLRGDSCFDVVV